jgi:hypothetical protein
LKHHRFQRESRAHVGLEVGDALLDRTDGPVDRLHRPGTGDVFESVALPAKGQVVGLPGTQQERIAPGAE